MMKLREIFEAYDNHIVPTYTKQPLIFVKGKGSYLWDIHNRRYLDFFPGWGVGNLGHCHPKVMSAVRDQISKLIFIPNNFYHIPQAKLARELDFWTSSRFKVFFCNSGTEANEAAIKFSRRFGKGRYEIISFSNSFHGRTLASLAATGQEKYKSGFEPLPLGFKTVAFNNLEEVKAAVNDKTVAVMLELVQGEGGVNLAQKDFVLALHKLCEEKKLLFIIDEVQTGIGRTGRRFAYEHYGIIPHIITLAKALGGGLPIGAMLVRRDIADILGPGTHASTFGGGPVICKAALAVLTVIQKEKLLKNTQDLGEYLKGCLLKLKEKYPFIKEVRGLGLMIGVELNKNCNFIVDECIKRGLLINCTHENVLRVMPALNITKKQIDQAVSILDEVLFTV